jgi:hypothetical protein
MAAVFENTTAYSVEVRVKFNSFTQWGNVFAKRITESDRDIVLQSFATDGSIGVAVEMGYGISTTLLTPGVWYHIAVVYDGSASTDSARLKLYIDGVQDPLNFAFGSVPSVSPVSPGSRFVIGAEYNTPAPVNNTSFLIVPFDGAVDELRVWNVARTEAAIVADMNNELTLPQANLAAYYQFNQGLACGPNAGLTNLPDLTGNYNGTLWNFSLTGTLSNYTTVVDTSVTVNGSTLSSNASPASYQWFNCGSQSVIPGQTLNSFTASSNGNYSVIVTQDFCVDTSGCYPVTLSGIQEQSQAGEWFYPNPATGDQIRFAGWDEAVTVSVMNMLGEQLDMFRLEQDDSYNISKLSPGVYLIAFYDKAGNKIGVKRLVRN